MILNPIIKNSQAGEYAHIIASAPHGATVSCDGVAGSEVRTVNPAWKGLPSGYKQVEYLESSGTEYIDTGVTFNSNYDFDIQFTPTAQNTGYDNTIFGSRIAWQQSMYMINYSIAGGKLEFYYGTQYKTLLSATVGNAYTIQKIGLNLYANGTLAQTYTSSSFTCPDTMWLFKGHTTGTGTFDNSSIMKLSYFRCSQNSSLVLDLVPCIRIADSVAGLYDLVSETFLTNAGTGTFTAGAEVPHYLDASTWTFDIDTYGEHTVVGTYNGNTKTNTVTVLTATDYLTSFDFILWLYNEGDEFNDVTGGWVDYKCISIWNKGTTATKNASNLYLYTAQDIIGIGFATTNKTDVTNYTKLCVNVLSHNSASQARTAYTVNTETKYQNERTSPNYQVVLGLNEIDISAVSGEQYVCLAIWQGPGNYITVDKIWLE